MRPRNIVNELTNQTFAKTEEQSSTTTQITTLQSSLTTHTTLLARETAEKSEITTQITDLESHAATQRDQRNKLQSAIATITKQIEQKRIAQEEYARKYEEQAGRNGPELHFWETYLGCRVDGAGEDGVVRVVYSFAPGPAAVTRGERGQGQVNNEEREAVFELSVPDVGDGGYNVTHCRPKLDTAKVGKVVERLNETRDIAVLLKGMRGLFLEEMGERMVLR